MGTRKERDVTARRSGLGRGLDALLPPEDIYLSGHESALQEVDTDLIDPNPRQPRRTWPRQALEELAESIRHLGLLQPLLVRSSGTRFELIAGERRLKAARLAGLSNVPVILVRTDDVGSLERALVENLHREDLNPIEEAAGYRQLLDEGGLTQEALARRLAKSRATVTNAIRLLDLPLPVQRLLIEGRLSAGHGKALLALTGNPFQERLATRASHDGLSVRETEELVRRYQSISGDGSGARTRSTRPAAISDAQRALADRLQTRVRVDMGKRKGKIVVDFVSLEELSRLLSIIVGDDPAASTLRVQSGAGPR
jgi:ParB family transcriptional regulator, chromosome partitioning protein